jgi:hypothetical protein
MPNKESAFDPFKHSAFTIFWLEALISNIGTWMNSVAASWLMADLRTSPLMVALVQTSTTLPVFLLALPAGALADIIDRRKLLIIINIFMMLAAALFAFIVWRNEASPLAVLSLPNWVRARGLAIFLMVFFGGISLGSAFWGWIANLYSVSDAMYGAALGAILFMLLTCKIKLQQGGEMDLTPSLHWPVPVVAEAVDFDQGPVMVTICYQIKPHDKQAFLRAIYQLKAVRMRNGVFRWGVFENIGKPGQFLECFMEDNWAEHLRHHNRMLKQDKILQDQVLAFHGGEAPPPK